MRSRAAATSDRTHRTRSAGRPSAPAAAPPAPPPPTERAQLGAVVGDALAHREAHERTVVDAATPGEDRLAIETADHAGKRHTDLQARSSSGAHGRVPP